LDGQPNATSGGLPHQSLMIKPREPRQDLLDFAPMETDLKMNKKAAFTR
jgi:hypothetical protein